MSISNKSTGGFTLLEILVAVSIIGILSAILYTSFGSARDNASNKALMTEIKEVQLAIELYKAQNGRYPTNTTCGALNSVGGYVESNSTACASGYIESITPDIISELPTHNDSRNSSCQITYKVEETNQSWYKLTAENCIAGGETFTVDSESARCPASCGLGSTPPGCDATTMSSAYFDTSDFTKSFAVYSLGGQCE